MAAEIYHHGEGSSRCGKEGQPERENERAEGRWRGSEAGKGSEEERGEGEEGFGEVDDLRTGSVGQHWSHIQRTQWIQLDASIRHFSANGVNGEVEQGYCRYTLHDVVSAITTDSETKIYRNFAAAYHGNHTGCDNHSVSPDSDVITTPMYTYKESNASSWRLSLHPCSICEPK